MSNIFTLSSKNGVDLQEIAQQYQLRTRFNKKAIAQADMAKITPDDYVGRVDYTRTTVFTIDGDDSRDFDDAVGIQSDKNGFTLFVHIADVAHYVKQGSALDKEAAQRGTSVYFPYGCLPMLPQRLSDDLCSLKQGEDRLTLSVQMRIDNSGNVTDTRIAEGVICSCARLTYKSAQEIIDGKNTSVQKSVADSLREMARLAQILVDKRAKSGCIDLDSAECEFVFEGERAVDVGKKQRLFSHRLIEEFMILANESVARKIGKGTPFLYRVHDAPSPQKAERLADFLQANGIDFVFDTTPTVAQLKEIFDTCPDDLRQVLGMMILRTMSKAVYSPARSHHYGLNLDYYCHFTSPIRRYPDLFIHRVIKAILKDCATGHYSHAKASKHRGSTVITPHDSTSLNAPKNASNHKGEERMSGFGSVKGFKRGLVELAEHCSKAERSADEASRRVDDIVKGQCMRQFLGQEFSGHISGVCDFGVFVQLPNTVEGLVRIENLSGYLIFDQRTMSLATRNKKVSYGLGDRLDVVVAGVSSQGKIEFELAK